METGWIKLHRKILQNDIWLLEPFTKGQAWVDLILLANHKDGKISVRGNILDIKRGQVGWSEVKLSKRWGWSRNKTRRYIKWLKTEQQIEQQKNSTSSIITILNYDTYQQTEQQTEQQTIQQKDSRRYTNKNDKNDKNIYTGEKNISSETKATNSSLQEKTDQQGRVEAKGKKTNKGGRETSSVKHSTKPNTKSLKYIQSPEAWQKIRQEERFKRYELSDAFMEKLTFKIANYQKPYKDYLKALRTWLQNSIDRGEVIDKYEQSMNERIAFYTMCGEIKNEQDLERVKALKFTPGKIYE